LIRGFCFLLQTGLKQAQGEDPSLRIYYDAVARLVPRWVREGFLIEATGFTVKGAEVLLRSKFKCSVFFVKNNAYPIDMFY